MHIKQVLVEGFKSYKDQTRTEPFSNKLNTIVGANGAGKSNFFQAIRFVLDAETSSLRQEERQKLLHEGAGHAVLSAFVEIVLDNSDGRIQVEKEEVRLRRTVGLKKDEYQLNKKKITKTEVSDILESAGFSKANPYYVVQQGKIMALSMMKDEERLDVLKEIGGSKVYEDRRKESLKVIQDADGRTQQIAELVSEMEAKLKQLDAERDELAKYQAIDRECRSLEYAIHDKEVSDARTKLDENEQQRREEAERAGKALDEREAAHVALKKTERELKQVATEQTREQAHLNDVSSSRADAQSKKAQLDLDVMELDERRKEDNAAEVQCREQAKALEKEIAHAERQLKGVKKTLEQRQEKVDDLYRHFNEGQRRREALGTKQGHRQNFATIKERDDYLKKELKLREAGRRKLQEQIQELERQIKAIETSKVDLNQDLELKKAEVKQLQLKCQDFPSAKRELEAKRNGLQDQKKDGQRKENDLKDREKDLQASIKRLEYKVDPGNRSHQRALTCVRKLSILHRIPLHGTVLELIDPIPQLCLATEVAAGGALFHLVVDTDEQASELLHLLKQEKEQGRVSCLPLNKLQVETVQYPDRFGTDALPLTKYLKYSEEVKRAVEQVFGKWMICKDSVTASKVIAITDNISCVTIEGDVHARKGTITGGHRDKQKVKLQAYKQKVLEDKQLESVQRERIQLTKDEGHIDNEITAVLGSMDSLELAHTEHSENLKRLEAAIQAGDEQMHSLDSAVQSKKKAIAENEKLLQFEDLHTSELHAELGTKELGKLTQAEVEESRSLERQLLQWQEELKTSEKLLDESKTLHAEVHGTLTNNLLKKKAELDGRMSNLATPENREAIEAKKEEAARVGAAMKKLEEQESKARQIVDSLQQKIDDLKAEADRLRELQKSGDADEGSNAMSKLLAKRDMLQQKKADHEKKIRELGSLPMDAFEKFQSKSLLEVNKLLSRAQKQLKKYGHVNKKALDQYLNFTEQKEELVKRHDETVRGKEKIQQLILNLDLRKDEAIERTFKGVAKNFREIFAELAPGGKGELVMQKATQKAAADVEEADPANDTNERYSGVKVKVSFGSGETMSLKQLSGGQKTLVALALIFSIQRLDPAPFYLFDEIDAALDPAYRSTVARMLARQSNDPTNPSQFIITTFHPQIVHESDQVYGVSHSARISTIDAITKEDALEFLNSEEKTAAEEEEDQ